MSIHCIMKTLKQLEAIDVEKDLKEIISNKFDDLLKISFGITDNEMGNWNIRYDDTHWFPVCLKTPEIIEFIHPNDAWSYWAQQVIETELAVKYDATMFDEEYPRQDFKPIPDSHSTFRKFLETQMPQHSASWKKAIIEIEIAHLPAALKNL